MNPQYNSLYTRNTLCYTSNVAKKAKLMRAYRLPKEIISEIERLSEEWECTHGEVVERAIAEIARTPRSNNRQTKELKVEYDVE